MHKQKARAMAHERGECVGALAPLVLGFAGLLGLAAAPYLRIAALAGETAEHRQLLAALETQTARRTVRGGDDPGALMLQGETAGIAEAALQRLVNEHVEAAGGQASSFQLLPSRESGGTARLSLGFAMRIDIEGLRDTLHAMETGEPLLFVDDIAIRRPENAAGEGRVDAPGLLDVTMQVSGFLLQDRGR
jgi:general secretion pathway protein M